MKTIYAIILGVIVYSILMFTGIIVCQVLAFYHIDFWIVLIFSAINGVLSWIWADKSFNILLNLNES